MFFSAKEKDEATGYHYFGARYYDSETSVWLSVDPMSDMYPHLSPYMYAEGNPVMMIDPNGMETIDYQDEWEIDPEGNVTRTGDKGGEDTQYINYTDEDGNTVETQEIDGAGFSLDKYNVATGEATNGDIFHDYYSQKSGLWGINTVGNKESASSSNTNDAHSNNNFISYTNSTLGISSEFMFSKTFNTWMGKDFKLRSQNWGGNGKTGGKFKFARATGRYFKWAGSAVGFYNIADTEAQFFRGNINQTQRIVEQISNGIGFIPTYGTAWTIGWGLGKEYGPSTWFGNNDNKWFR